MVMRVLHFLVFSLVGPFVYGEGSQPNVVQFEDLPRLVREKNENVQAAHLSVKAHEERMGRLARSFLPNISAQVGAEEFKTGSDPLERQGYWKVGAELNLYRGGKDYLDDKIKESSVRSAKYDLSREFQRELLEARQTYWKLVALTQKIKHRKESVEKNESNLKSARRRSGAGIATAADTVQFELQQTLLNQEVRKMELESDLLKNRLSVALGSDEHESLEIQSDFPKLNKSDSEAAPLDVRKHIDVANLNEKQNTEALKAEMSSRWWRPSLDVYSSYGIPSLSDEYSRALRRDTEWTIGVKVGFNLGQGLEDRTEASAKAFESKSVEKIKAHRLREVKAADHELRHDLKLLYDLINATDLAMGKSEKYLKLTQDEYRRGVKNGPDLLGSFQQYYEYKSRQIDLYRDYYEAKAELDALLAQDRSI